MHSHEPTFQQREATQAVIDAMLRKPQNIILQAVAGAGYRRFHKIINGIACVRSRVPLWKWSGMNLLKRSKKKRKFHHETSPPH